MKNDKPENRYRLVIYGSSLMPIGEGDILISVVSDGSQEFLREMVQKMESDIAVSGISLTQAMTLEEISSFSESLVSVTKDKIDPDFHSSGDRLRMMGIFIVDEGKDVFFEKPVEC